MVSEALTDWSDSLIKVQPGEKDRYDIDPDSHLSAYLFVAVEAYRESEDSDVFMLMMSTIFARDYVRSSDIELFIDKLRNQGGELVGLVEESWAIAMTER